MRRFMIAAPTAVLMVAMAIPAAAKPGPATAAKPGSQTIAQIASGSSDFNILVAALSEAGLVGALNGKGQFTVFAPNDQAFLNTFRTVLGNQNLQEGDVIGFISNGGVDAAFGQGALADILLYHVTEGRRISTSVLAAPMYKMLNGDMLTKAELVGAGVVPADLSASNGIIHVLTTGVLLP